MIERYLATFALFVPLLGCSVATDATPPVSQSGEGGSAQGGEPGASADRPGDPAVSISVELGGGAPVDTTGAAAGIAEELLCDNGNLDGAEACDDGNAAPGDGCSGICAVENGYACPVPGGPCELLIVCGDGEVGEGERCDDGNTAGGDGCAANCSSIDGGFLCPPEGGSCTALLEACGNALQEFGEECDDANTRAGDGCSADCRMESGWSCAAPGEPCQPLEYCGDAIVSFTLSELCDDGNPDPGDGCSELCRIESGWVCTGEPSECTYDVVCGDQRIRGKETCDDGNRVSGDGCDEACSVEVGFTCPAPGAACRPICGDSLVLGREECDDGNVANEDGCSETCQEEDGWVCPPDETCRPTRCGDGVKEGAESCDDGNDAPFDGCSSACLSEPTCGTEESAQGECSSQCGDGILVAATGEECDDGNTLDGDGCSAHCLEEAGFDCVSFYEEPPDTIAIPIVYRDFVEAHPDFGDFCCDWQTGIVEAALGADRKPVYTGTDAEPVHMTSGLTNFDQWYRDVLDINQTFYETLTLVRGDSGSYSMDSDTDEPWVTREGFFPLESQVEDPTTGEVTFEGWGFGNEWAQHNYLFTSELRYWFEFQGGEQLDFSGDDDVWVFVNGKLAVDLGGVHPRMEGSVILDLSADGTTNAEYGLTVGKIYEIAIFQAERWCCGSNYWVTLSNFVAGKSACEPVCGDGLLTADEACDLGTDANGDSLNTGEYGGCTPDCQLADFCGDGVTNGDEQCDDGSNLVPYDARQVACGPGCRLPHHCGDAILDTAYGEVCDAGAANAADAYGAGACTDTCQIGPYCGDGLRNGSDEGCDEGALNGGAEADCDLGCQVRCGNGVLDPGEACDLGEALNVGEYGGCTSECTLGPRCGDGIKNGDEACDDGANDGSYGTCMPDCSVGPYCGDGVVDGPEQCDLGHDNQADPYGPHLCTTHCAIAPYCGDGVIQGNESCDGGTGCDSECRPAPVT